MDTIVIIQARMGSSRLPGKVLKPLGSNDTLTYVVERCKLIKGVEKIIIATSKLPQDDAIYDWCKSKEITCYRGSEEDVLERFIDISELHKPKYLVRVTADCPFIDFKMASEMISLIKQESVEIIDIEDPLPRGIVSEVFSRELLKKIAVGEKEARHREHVTYFAYEYPHLFTRRTYNVNGILKGKDFRITLDTLEDYKMLSHLAEHFDDITVSIEEVVRYLTEHPEIAQINAHIEQKPVV